ncbi:unnamed protein product [Rotaria sp. Silwood2]|nr:unnamed protein product [Rotaria sp. Silwood2]CAF4578017.1 unnamed protein product [Rotaria sp. Silwood2]CAF4786722.1 unnamed protein product [Rotaria sp. Silwood2]
MSDVAESWQVPLSDGVHKIEFEYGTTSGKRVIRVDNKEVLLHDCLFKLVEKDTLDLWVNSQRIEADATFSDEGGEIVFDIGGHQVNVKAISSGNPRLGINHVLFVDEVEVSQESGYDNS